MTKKDYVKLAAVFQSTQPKKGVDSGVANLCFQVETAVWKEIRQGIIGALANDNPRFDRARFIQATEA